MPLTQIVFSPIGIRVAPGELLGGFLPFPWHSSVSTFLVALKGTCHILTWRTAILGHDPAAFASQQSKQVFERAKNGDIMLGDVSMTGEVGGQASGFFVPLGWSCGLWCDEGDPCTMLAWPHTSKNGFVNGAGAAARMQAFSDMKKFKEMMQSSPLGKSYEQYLELEAALK